MTEEGPLTLLGTYLDIRDRVLCCDERGLLGLAFHPNYASNGYFFVYYTHKEDGVLQNGDVVIARYRAQPPTSNTVNSNTESILLTIEHSTHGNHNGGGMAFGPDGYLYASVGDGGGGGDPLGSGQSLATHLGKVLRFDVDVNPDVAPFYEVPGDNPFVGTPGAMEEIWAWGLRNPWRISFDRLTGDLFIADVGQNNREEVNFQLADSAGGVNYGWPRMEGIACYNPSSGCQTGSLVLPILDYSHSDGCSITGGYRYRGTAVPTLHGTYVFGDYCSKKIWAGVQAGNGAWSRVELLSTNLSISTFGEDADGELYVAALEGAVYRLVRVPYGATYQASTFAIASGATLTVPVTVTNTGSLPWDANSAFRLAYHWYQGSTLVTWDGLRTILLLPFPPAEASPSRPPSRLRPRPAPTPSSGTWSGSPSPGSPARAWLRRPSPSLSPPARLVPTAPPTRLPPSPPPPAPPSRSPSPSPTPAPSPGTPTAPSASPTTGTRAPPSSPGMGCARSSPPPFPPAEASPSRPPSRLRPRPAPTPSSGTWSGSLSPGSPARAWLRRPSPSLSPPARLVPTAPPTRLPTFATASGATLTVPVTVTNTGSLPWDANSAFRLAYHWYQGSTLVTWDGLRTILPSSVPPGGSLTLQASVKAPASAGTYTLKWDMSGVCHLVLRPGRGHDEPVHRRALTLSGHDWTRPAGTGPPSGLDPGKTCTVSGRRRHSSSPPSDGPPSNGCDESKRIRGHPGRSREVENPP